MYIRETKSGRASCTESCCVATKAPDALWRSPLICNIFFAVALYEYTVYAVNGVSWCSLTHKFETEWYEVHSIFAWKMQITIRDVCWSWTTVRVWLAIFEVERYLARICSVKPLLYILGAYYSHVVFIFFCFSKINHNDQLRGIKWKWHV